MMEEKTTMNTNSDDNTSQNNEENTTPTIKQFSKNFFNNYINRLLDQKLRTYGYFENLSIDYNDDDKILLSLELIKKIDDIDVELILKIKRNGDIKLQNYFMHTYRYELLVNNEVNRYDYKQHVQLVHKINCYDDGIYDEDSCYCNSYKLNVNDLKKLVANINWDAIFTEYLNRKYHNVIDNFISENYDDNDLKNLGFEIDDCVVCYNSTTSKCKNNHHICRICYLKLNRKFCPCCRIVLNGHNYNLKRQCNYSMM